MLIDLFIQYFPQLSGDFQRSLCNPSWMVTRVKDITTVQKLVEGIDGCDGFKIFLMQRSETLFGNRCVHKIKMNKAREKISELMTNQKRKMETDTSAEPANKKQRAEESCLKSSEV